MSTFAAYGRQESAQPSCIPDWIAEEANPVRKAMFLRWLFGRRLLADPVATTPAGNLRHGVLGQLIGSKPPAKGAKRRNTKPPVLSDELLRELADIQGQIDHLSGLRRGGADVGHVYVLRFTTGVVKVGKAVNPATRIAAHRRHAQIHGVAISDGYVSDVHPYHSRTERQLIDYCAQQGSRIAEGNEYFTGVEFDAACDFADRIVTDCLVAAMGGEA
jgi:hypothetical protein